MHPAQGNGWPDESHVCGSATGTRAHQSFGETRGGDHGQGASERRERVQSDEGVGAGEPRQHAANDGVKWLSERMTEPKLLGDERELRTVVHRQAATHRQHVEDEKGGGGSARHAARVDREAEEALSHDLVPREEPAG